MLRKYHVLSRHCPSTFNDAPLEMSKFRLGNKNNAAVPLFAQTGFPSRFGQRNTSEQKSGKVLDIGKGST